MDYTFAVSSLAISLGLNPVQAIQGTLLASEVLPLSIGFSSVGAYRGRSLQALSLSLVLGLAQATFRRGASAWQISSSGLRIRLNNTDISFVSYYEIPQTIPSSREFVPPSYSLTQSRTQAGTIVQRLWASRPGGGSLRFGFVNIPDLEAQQLAAIWDRAKGRRYSVTLPSRMFRGMSAALLSQLELNGLPLKWGFSRQPVVRSVIPGISSIELEFTARGYGGQALPVITVPDPPREWLVSTLQAGFAIRSMILRLKIIAVVNCIQLQLTQHQISLAVFRYQEIQQLVIGLALSAATMVRAKNPFVSESLALLLTLSTSIMLTERILSVESFDLVAGLPIVQITLGPASLTLYAALFLFPEQALYLFEPD